MKHLLCNRIRSGFKFVMVSDQYFFTLGLIH